MPPKRRSKRNTAKSRHYEAALDELYAPLASWVHYGSASDKRELLAAYAGLSEAKRDAWDRSVGATFREYHGADSSLMYRRIKAESPTATSGTSVTTEKSETETARTVATYRVHASDVLAHHAQTDTPLASKAYGHEREVILRPGNEAELVSVEKKW